MPKTKPRRRQTPHERPYVSNLELRHALEEKLSERELNALEKQITTAVQIATERAVYDTITATFVRHWAVLIRVMRDRFGWGQQRLLRLYDLCKDYLVDIAEERITVEEMLAVIEHDDDIRILWDKVQHEDVK